MNELFPAKARLAACRMITVAATVAAVGLMTTAPAHAELNIGAGPDWVAGGYFVAGKPTAFGGEVSLAAMFQPSSEHELLLGPKAGALLAWGENGVTRLDANFGVAEMLWVVNAFGGGWDFDVVAPSTITGEDSAVHYRITPNLAVRVMHTGSQGAWALRFGVPYDTHYKWGIQAGVTLQMGGVPNLQNSF